MATRARVLKPDRQGRYRPRIGWAIALPGGKRYQPRFNLGRNEAEALVRYEKIQRMFDDCCCWLRDPDVPAEEQDVWSDLSLELADQIADGWQRVELPTFKIVFGRADEQTVNTLLDVEDTANDMAVSEYARQLDIARRRHPWLTILPADAELHNTSLRANQRYVKNKVDQLRDALVKDQIPLVKGEIPEQLAAGTLHEALDAYVEHIRKTGEKLKGEDKLVPYQRKRIEQVARLKRVHPNTQVYSLNFDWCAEAIATWQNRPATQKGGPCSQKDAKNHLGQLGRFLKWLDRTSQFGWTMPRGVELLPRNINKTKGVRRNSGITIKTYGPAQLAIINRHANPLERLCLYLGLNCAFRAAELGRVEIGDFTFSTPHPEAEDYEFVSTHDDHFLKMNRPKTDVYGEWLLWPEVADMARWSIERAKRIGSRILLVRETGKPIYDEALANPQAGFANMWNRLLDRVQKSHSDFPRLPFGSLRDTLPNLLRQRYDDEIASLCLAHGSPSKNDLLLNEYANKPFGRLFKALRELRGHYAPVFAAAPNPLDDAKHYLPVERKDKVRTLLAEGKGVAEVVRECGVSRATVYRVQAAVERRSQDAGFEQPEISQVEEAG